MRGFIAVTTISVIAIAVTTMAVITMAVTKKQAE